MLSNHPKLDAHISFYPSLAHALWWKLQIYQFWLLEVMQGACLLYTEIHPPL